MISDNKYHSKLWTNYIGSGNGQPISSNVIFMQYSHKLNSESESHTKAIHNLRWHQLTTRVWHQYGLPNVKLKARILALSSKVKLTAKMDDRF